MKHYICTQCQSDRLDECVTALCMCDLAGQVVNMLREDRMAKCSNAYRPHLTSHISLPSHHRAGITLFVTTQSPAFDRLQHSWSADTVD